METQSRQFFYLSYDLAWYRLSNGVKSTYTDIIIICTYFFWPFLGGPKMLVKSEFEGSNLVSNL